MTSPNKSSDGEHPIYVVFDHDEYEMLMDFKKRLAIQKNRNVSNRKALSIALYRVTHNDVAEPESVDVANSNNKFLEDMMSSIKEQMNKNKDVLKEAK